MLSYLLIALFFGIIGAIYWGIWHGTRQKLSDEQLKEDFLEHKFKGLEGREFDKNTQPDKILDESLLSTFNNNGFKKGKIKSVTSSLPYSDKKPWKVFVSIKAGTWPFTDKEEDIEIFSILDNELEELNEYNEFKNK